MRAIAAVLVMACSSEGKEPPRTEPAKPTFTNERVENGVTVFDMNTTMWCAQSGQRRGFCFPTRKRCEQEGAACSEQRAASCTLATSVTSGRETDWCFVDYGACTRFRSGIANNAEYRDAKPCIVLRHP